jgi:hypothetical protein
VIIVILAGFDYFVCNCWQTFYKVWPDDGALTPKHVATANIKAWK